VLIRLLFLCVTLGASAGLEWETTDLAFTPTPMDKSVRGSFVFRNMGDSPVAITRVRSSCRCTVATADREQYSPGESGVIDVVFEHVKRPGEQSKQVYVFTDDSTAPMTVLKMRVAMPKLVEVAPGYVSWRKGEPATPKEIRFSVLVDHAISLREVQGDSTFFDWQLVALEKGREYAVRVTPKTTTERGKTSFTLVTDHTVDGRPFTYTAHAGVLPARVAQADK
jgi:hypothetical protein